MQENVAQRTSTNSVKRERFIRIAESRVNKILSNLDNLSKCANKRNYDYADEQVRKIFREIERKVKETKAQFHGDEGRKGKFRLQ